MIRNSLEFEVVTKRVRYLEAQLAVLVNDCAEDERSLQQRAQLRVEIDDKKQELAVYVSGDGLFR
jgi:hypothetical protein